MLHSFHKQFSRRGNRAESLLKHYTDHLHLIETMPGSSSNHQAWEGGYASHLDQCFDIASHLYETLPFHKFFTWESVTFVLYFHDIEKLWRGQEFDKEEYLTKTLAEKYNITFTEMELNALKYIHGEGSDYRKDKRVMNELAAFCHTCDILSARCFHSIEKLEIG